MSPQLKLIALDTEDLAVISTHVQDARVQTSDIVWRPGEKRLVIGMNRLDWEQTMAGETSPRRLGGPVSGNHRRVDGDWPSRH